MGEFINEYIDREKALDALLFGLVGTGCQSRAISAIRDVPTADVIPRSEYEKVMGVIKEVHRLATEVKAELPLLVKQTKTEIAREIFEEIDKLAYQFMNDEHYIFGDMVWDIAELKKKYTGGE